MRAYRFELSVHYGTVTLTLQHRLTSDSCQQVMSNTSPRV
jgi:hypothetical protein